MQKTIDCYDDWFKLRTGQEIEEKISDSWQDVTQAVFDDSLTYSIGAAPIPLKKCSSCGAGCEHTLFMYEFGRFCIECFPEEALKILDNPTFLKKFQNSNLGVKPNTVLVKKTWAQCIELAVFAFHRKVLFETSRREKEAEDQRIAQEKRKVEREKQRKEQETERQRLLEEKRKEREERGERELVREEESRKIDEQAKDRTRQQLNPLTSRVLKWLGVQS